ncbi:GNAT family N-acetyltransferase [Shewanella sp. 3B26]|uniref:GNAT family N-acetyltransferase n=1 Tax=Shewanella zhuhaiensis TaxID=2919576 RepID=A0AAJ1BK05_9GAMM|nr:GNAT family N-acetyltransferase [Shewanella zhuhaiensis]
MQPFTTERLTLREFTAEDWQEILALVNTQDFINNIGDRGIRDEAGARQYLQDGPINSYGTHGFGLWRVSLTADDRFIGTCGLIRRDSLPDVDIGYGLLPAFYGQGYAQEAASACMTLRSRFGINQVVAIVTEANLPSRRLLEKIGLEFSHKIQFGEPAEELLLYKLLTD